MTATTRTATAAEMAAYMTVRTTAARHPEPEKMAEELAQHGYTAGTAVGTIGNGDKVHALVTIEQVVDGNLVILSAASTCGSQRWIAGLGKSSLHMVDDFSEVTCSKCRR